VKFLVMLQKAGLIAGLLFAAGFGVESSVGMPGYAAVYLDDASKTYGLAFQAGRRLCHRPAE